MLPAATVIPVQRHVLKARIEVTTGNTTEQNVTQKQTKPLRLTDRTIKTNVSMRGQVEH